MATVLSKENNPKSKNNKNNENNKSNQATKEEQNSYTQNSGMKQCPTSGGTASVLSG